MKCPFPGLLLLSHNSLHSKTFTVIKPKLESALISNLQGPARPHQHEMEISGFKLDILSSLDPYAGLFLHMRHAVMHLGPMHLNHLEIGTCSRIQLNSP